MCFIPQTIGPWKLNCRYFTFWWNTFSRCLPLEVTRTDLMDAVTFVTCVQLISLHGSYLTFPQSHLHFPDNRPLIKEVILYLSTHRPTALSHSFSKQICFPIILAIIFYSKRDHPPCPPLQTSQHKMKTLKRPFDIHFDMMHEWQWLRCRGFRSIVTIVNSI